MGKAALTPRRLVYGIFLSGLLLLAGCANSTSADNPHPEKNSGFYGGVTGGGSWP